MPRPKVRKLTKGFRNAVRQGANPRFPSGIDGSLSGGTSNGLYTCFGSVYILYMVYYIGIYVETRP